MKNTITKLVVGFIFFGLALGLSFMLGDGILDPIKQVMSYSGSYIRYTVVEVIGQRILQFVGIFFIWTLAIVGTRFVSKEIINS